MKFPETEPQEREGRPEWSEVPKDLVQDIEKILNQKIIKGEIVWGGYSPTAAFIITCKTGQKFFIKGTHPEQTAHGAEALRQEIAIYKDVKFLKTISPEYLGMVQYGGEDDWLLGVWEYIDNADAALPWTMKKVKSVLKLLSDMHIKTKENKLYEIVPDGLQINFISNLVTGQGGWLRLEDEPEVFNNFRTLFTDEEKASKWLLHSLPILCEYQRKAEVLYNDMPQNLIHFDLRSDNILFRENNQPVLLDWPNACWAPIAYDLVLFLISVSGESGLDINEALEYYSEISGYKVDKEHLKTVLAVSTGYFATNAYRGVPDKLPRLRWIQKLCLYAGLHWAEEVLDLPKIPDFKTDNI